jgi:CspA family cold shock protein
MTRELQDQAKAYMSRNEWEPAIACLEQAKAIEPDNTYILGPLAFCHSRLQHHNQAIELYEHLCQLESTVARWPYALGYQYYDQQKYEQAIEHFDKALAIEPNYIVVLYRKGYALSQLGQNRCGEALTALERCRDAYHTLTDEKVKDRERKHYTDACYQQGKLFADAGNHRLAQERLEEAAALNNKDAAIQYALGKSYLETSNITEAISSLEAAQKLSSNPEHYIIDRLIKAYASAGRLAEAIQLYEESPPFIQNRPYILRNIGELYLQLEDWQKAEKALRTAVQKEYQNHNGHYLLGVAQQHQEKWRQAANAFQNAIELRQKNYNLPFPQAKNALDQLLADHPEVADDVPKTWPVSSSGRPVGKVKMYNSDRGFGFLSIPDSKKDLFFHISEVQGRESVKEGEFFEYTLTEGNKGPQATNLQSVSDI